MSTKNSIKNFFRFSPFYALLLTLLSLLGSSGKVVGQVLINSEADGLSIPVGWIGKNNITSQAIQQSGYYLLQSSGSSYDSLITPTISSLNGATSLVIECQIATYGSGTNSHLRVDISFDDGATISSSINTLGTPTSATYINTTATYTGTITSNNVRLKFYDGVSGDKSVRLKSIVIKAFFPVEYSITFDPNGGTGLMPNQSASSATDLNPNLFSRSGHVFAGWNTASDGSGASYADEESFPFTADATLYAQWTPTSGSNVTFNANGGTGSMSTQNASSPTNLSSNTFTRTGYSFTGWNTASNGLGTSYTDGQSYDFSADLTLYAQWQINAPILSNQSFSGTIGNLFTENPTNTGGTASSWTLSSGSLPAGISLNSSTGQLSGTPSVSGTFTFSLNASNSTSNSTASYTISISAVPSSLANYLFTGTSCTAAAFSPSSVVANTSFSNISTNTITCNTNAANSFSGTTSTSWGTAFSSTRYIEFTITPSSGYLVTLTSLNFDVWRSGAGATNVVVRSSLDGYVADLATESVTTTSANKTVTLSSSFVGLYSAITFRIYGFGGNSTGDLRLDNINLLGYVYPACTPPADPAGTFNLTSNCGNTDVQFLPTLPIPSGVDYFWQSTASGVSTAGTDAISVVKNTTSNSIFFVRAYHAGDNCWSTNSVSQLVTIVNAPYISTEPVNASVVSGNTATFSVVASNASSYQWQVNTGSGWNNVSTGSGATTATYQTENTTSGMNGYFYRVVVGGTSPCTPINSNGLALTVSNATVNSISNQSSVYGSTVSVTATATGAVSSWSATLPAGLSINSSGVISGTLTEQVAGSAFASSVTANFTAGGSDTKIFTWTITPKALTVSGFTGSTKEYDGNTTATLSGTGTLVGIVGADVVSLSGTPSATFSTATVGNNKPITVSGYTLSGAQAGNYTLTQPTGITANITPKALNVSGAAAQNKVYDGNTTASITGGTLVGVVGADVVTLSGGGTFATANAGTGIAVSANLLTLAGAQAANYTLTLPTGLSANITKANPVFTTSPISIAVGGTYSLPGSNISSTSNGALSYTISSGGNATLAGTTITGVVVGSETLTVNQVASANYNAGSTTVAVNVVTVSYSIGDYRTNPSFTGTSIFFNSTSFSSGIAPWQMWDGTAWVDVVHIAGSLNAPQNLATKPENIYLNFSNVDIAGGGTFNNIYIQGGYVFSGNTATGLTIASNKILDIEAGYFYLSGKFSLLSGSTVTVRENAEFEIASSSFNFTRNASSNFIVEDNAFVYINNYLANVWGGNENFSGDSYFIVYGWSKDDRLFENQTDISNNSLGSKFGYLEIEIASLTGNWGFVFPAENFKLTNRDFLLANNSTSNVNLNAGTMEIGGDFIINGTGNVQMRTQSGLKITNVTGNFVKNGSGQFRLNSSTDIVNLVELNVGGNFTINAGGFSLDNGATANLVSRVNLKGNLTKTISSQMLNSNTNSSLVSFNFTGGAAQTVDLNVQSTIDMVRYRFFVKSGAYVRLVNQDWKIATDSKVTVENGGTLDFGWDLANVPLKLIINNSQSNTAFELQDGGTLVLTSTDIQGAITANGINFGNVQTGSRIYHATGGSYVFKGLNNQYFRNSSSGSIPSKGKNLTIDNGTKNVFLGNDFTASNLLDMKGGNVFVETDKILELGENTSNKGTLSYTSGYVVGKMRRWFNGTNSGNATGLFPMGVDESGLKNRFSLIEYTTAPATGGHLTVEFKQIAMGLAGLTIPAASTGGFGLDVTSTEDQGYWKIDNQALTLTDGAYTISCTGQGFATITNLSQITLLKRVGGGNWFCPGTHQASTGSNSEPTAIRSGVSGWSNFGFGAPASVNPLPVELVQFVATCDQDKTHVTWSTASEQNAAYFEVEESVDGINWRVVSKVNAIGNSVQLNGYETELAYQSGTTYYRLNQVDMDGKSTLSGVIVVACGDAAIQVYPNPTNEWIFIQHAPENVEISLFAMDGRKVKQEIVQQAQAGISLQGIEQGTYHLQVRSNGQLLYQTKVVKIDK